MNGETNIIVGWEISTSKLDEVQIIAYGINSPRFQTGNVTSVKAKDLEKQPVNNPLLALQGRVPGLFLTQQSGLPGSAIKVRIQGKSSILNGNTPLYIVDGIPYPTALPPNIGIGPLGTGTDVENSNTLGYGNALSLINLSDIESIDVLKDADATAIYGSRAANGAVLITTKKGKQGKTTVSVNIQNGWARLTNKLDMLNTQQYIEMRKEAFSNDSLIPNISNAPDLLVWDTTRFTDWQRKLLGGTAKYTNVNASVSGGTNVLQYLISGTYQRETTIFPGNFADRKGSMHVNLNGASANQKFLLQFTGDYMVDVNELPSVDFTVSALATPPNAPTPYNSDGSLNWMLDSLGRSTWIGNPYAALHRPYQNISKSLRSNITIIYRILSGLEFKSSFGFNNISSNEYELAPLYAINPQSILFGEQRAGLYGEKRISSWVVEPHLTYKKDLNRAKLDWILGSTIQQNDNNGSIILGYGHSSDLLLKDIKSSANLFVASSMATKYRYNAIFSRLNVNIKEKYVVNLSLRRDGSSRFGGNNRFGNFGAVGLAWIFSDEKSIRDNLNILSFGKARASYGLVGNDQIADYRYLNLYSAINTGTTYQGINGLEPTGLANSHLNWELTKKLQLGLDLGFFNDRILVNVTYGRNRSSNQLLEYQLPSVTGNSGIVQNFPAVVENTSWEFSLVSENVKHGNFTWSTSINLTTPRNKLIDFPNLLSTPYAGTLTIGQPLGTRKVLHFLGVDPVSGVYQFARQRR